jgi:hypothetical protein
VLISNCSSSSPPLPALFCAVAASAATAADLCPADSAAAIDDFLATAHALETSSAAWLPPTCFEATVEDRAAARGAIESALSSLDAALAGAQFLAGITLTLADVCVSCSALGLFQVVLGKDSQAHYANVTRWLSALAAHPNFAAVLGGCLAVALNSKLSRSPSPVLYCCFFFFGLHEKVKKLFLSFASYTPVATFPPSGVVNLGFKLALQKQPCRLISLRLSPHGLEVIRGGNTSIPQQTYPFFFLCPSFWVSISFLLGVSLLLIGPLHPIYSLIPSFFIQGKSDSLQPTPAGKSLLPPLWKARGRRRRAGVPPLPPRQSIMALKRLPPKFLLPVM